MPKFKVTVEFIRIAEIDIEATDALDARSKIGNYDFDPDIIGDLNGWRVVSTEEKKEEVKPKFSSDSALSLAKKRIGIPH